MGDVVQFPQNVEMICFRSQGEEFLWVDKEIIKNIAAGELSFEDLSNSEILFMALAANLLKDV